MSHGPQHFENNNWQGKGCHRVCRITINIAWPEQNPILDSSDRNTRQCDKKTLLAEAECDKKTLLAEADASKKRNLTLVGGYADNAVDLCGEGNADTKRPCLGKGQTMLTKQPSQAEFEECWSEAIIKCGLQYSSRP